MTRTSKWKSNSPSQWRLSTLLVLMLGFAFLFAGISRIHSRTEMHLEFSALPVKDDAFVSWLKTKHRASDLTISRPSANAVSVEFSRPIYLLEIPTPPWAELGYGTFSSMTFAQKMVTSWWIYIGLATILCAGWISRASTTLAHSFRGSNQSPKQNPPQSSP